MSDPTNTLPATPLQAPDFDPRAVEAIELGDTVFKDWTPIADALTATDPRGHDWLAIAQTNMSAPLDSDGHRFDLYTVVEHFDDVYGDLLGQVLSLVHSRLLARDWQARGVPLDRPGSAAQSIPADYWHVGRLAWWRGLTASGAGCPAYGQIEIKTASKRGRRDALTGAVLAQLHALRDERRDETMTANALATLHHNSHPGGPGISTLRGHLTLLKKEFDLS